METGDLLFKVSTGFEGLQSKAILDQISELEELLEITEKYEISLKVKKNLMSSEGNELEYYGKVEYYLDLLKTEVYEEDSTRKELKEKNKERQAVDTVIKNLQDQYGKLKNQDNYEEDKKNIENQLDIKQSEKEGITEEVKNIEKQLENPYSQGQQTYHQLLSELGQARTSTQNKLTELYGNLEVSEGQDAISNVKATHNGIVHYLTPITMGMSVQQNQVIAEISKGDPDDFIIEAYIHASDRSKINTGDAVNVAIAGVNAYKFGTVSGTVMQIDQGTITQETSEGSLVLYRVLIDINESRLTSKDQEVVEVIRSMPVEARIVYKQESYFEWILQMLNFRN